MFLFVCPGILSSDVNLAVLSKAERKFGFTRVSQIAGWRSAAKRIDSDEIGMQEQHHDICRRAGRDVYRVRACEEREPGRTDIATILDRDSIIDTPRKK